jgi:hypothetical protein
MRQGGILLRLFHLFFEAAIPKFERRSACNPGLAPSLACVSISVIRVISGKDLPSFDND